MITEEIRSYEVSIWTLQDEFLTVLKWSDAEQKGRIENPKMVLNIDGTQEFTFSIPMYYYKEGQLIDNPNWYNTLNGNLIEGLRKIKVIFNKGNKELEEIFEFLIITAEDSHEKDIASCSVKCEGLAFHELGKQGYKISLSQENFEEKYKEWAKSDKTDPEPVCTLDYWCGDKATCDLPIRPTNTSLIDPNTWYYTVQMNQKSFKSNDDGIIRSSAKIYEEPFPTEWNDDLIPKNYVDYKEKARIVTADKSNLYNLTQSIAEAFQVHCRYEYTHDENYHITSRTIVFYNHFFQEEEGTMSFTYPYSSSKITRNSDCTNLTTKLYVLTTDNDKTVAGYNSIMNASANPTAEDYILNFDYMYKRGIISEDQYAAIKPYEIAMKDYNERLIIFQQNKAAYDMQKPELEGKIAVYKKSISIDSENIAQNQKLANALSAQDGDGQGNIIIDESHPDMRVIQQDKDGIYYINLESTNKGIQSDTVHIYRKYSSANTKLSVEVESGFTFKNDEYGRPSRILGIAPQDNSSTVYLTYKYKPRLYYDAVVKVWDAKLKNDQAEYAALLSKLGPESSTDTKFDLAGAYGYYAKQLNLNHKVYVEASTNEINQVFNKTWTEGLNKQIQDTEEKIKSLQTKKNATIKEFNRVMGAALREGYWQPEDYKDYGINKEHDEQLVIVQDPKIDTGDFFIAFWDDELFEEEDKNYYEISIKRDPVYYPCIDLSRLSQSVLDNIMNYKFIFNNNYSEPITSTADIRFTQLYSIGSGALLEFGKNKTTGAICPLLVLVGAKAMSNEELAFMMRNTAGNTPGGNPRLGQIIDSSDGTYSFSGTPINVASYFVNGSDYVTVYPRVKFSSLNLRADSTDMIVRYADQKLTVAEDYNIYTRNTPRTITYTEDGVTTNMTQYFSEYFLTVKPEVLYKCQTFNGNFNIHYILSNADNQIYLDAIEISKENAYPKVEYTVSPNILNRNLSKTLYQKLATLIMINDTQLKLEDVFGYISKVELDLDNVTKDSVEVKNYSSKFEDLFSTIVAQTAQMKQDSAQFHAAIEGYVPLEESSFKTTLSQNDIVMQAYLDSYFDSSQVVRDKLTELFLEASEILSDSNKSLNKMRTLTLENASILSGFAENIMAELTPKVYRQADKPIDFKPGDIWIDNENNHYVATSFSENSVGSGTAGFVRTRDGTLASIKGAGMDVDAEKGIIDIYAENELNLRSGKHVYIAADDAVDIVGNKSVNIGGCTINIVAESSDNLSAGGINLISTGVNMGSSKKNQPNVNAWKANHLYHENEYISVLVNNQIKYYKCTTEHTSESSFSDTNWTTVSGTIEATINNAIANTTNASLSKVLIHPDKIDMAGADITIRGGNGIKLIASRGDHSNTSAISIDPDDGVYIGSGKCIRLFSGKVGVTGDTISYLNNSNQIIGASVELNQEHLIMGFANIENGSATAIEMNEKFVIIAAGNNITGNKTTDDNKNITGTVGGLIGAKFTNESIGFATQTNSTINAIIMNDNGITLGSSEGGIDLANSSTVDIRNYFNTPVNGELPSGSYVRIASEGIELGSLADLYINTDNFKLQTHSRDKDNANSDFEDGETIMALGNKLQDIGYDTEYDPTLFNNTGGFRNGQTVIGTINNKPNVRLLVNKNGLYINGTVYAGAGRFTGDIVANSFLLNNGNDYTITTSYAITVIDPLNEGNYPNQPDDTDSQNDPFRYTRRADALAAVTAEGYLWTRITTTIGGQSTSAYSCEHVNDDGTTKTVQVAYAINSSATIPQDSAFIYSTAAAAKAATSQDDPFIIMRTKVFQNFAWTTTYSISKIVDGLVPYVNIVQTIYTLRAATQSGDAPDPATIVKPSTGITEDGDIGVTTTNTGTNTEQSKEWSLAIPTYPTQPELDNQGIEVHKYYYYYKCIQRHWINPPVGQNEWDTTDPMLDYGLSVANQYATSASIAATDAAHAASPITGYGLIGRNDPSYLYKNNGTRGTNDPLVDSQNNTIDWSLMAGYPQWNNTTYGLILGNNQQLPMLIGGNNGVTIVDTNGANGNGAAIALKGGGIGLHGSSIVLTTTSDNTVSRSTSQGGYTYTENNTTTNALVLDKDGIVMGTSGNIQLLSSNFQVKSSPGIGENYFYVGDANQTKYVKYTQDGTLVIQGIIHATSGGTIGGWNINSTSISKTVEGFSAGVNMGSDSDYTFWAGTSSTSPEFKVSKAGVLTATGADINGKITSSNGKIASWSFDANALKGSGTNNDTVFLGKKTKNTLDWIIYVGANEPEGDWSEDPEGWVGERPDYWAPFRVNSKGELYTEVLCIGNGPANAAGDTTVGGNGWANYVGKIWLFVKYDDNDYRWECIDSTALWKAVKDSSSNSSSTVPYKPSTTTPSGGDDSVGGSTSHGGGCFVAGTQVTLTSGETISIEKLQLGMKIIAYDEIEQKFDEAEVTFVQMLKHKTDIYDIYLSTGKVITLTASHPLLTTTGWKSLDIDMTNKEYQIIVNNLQIGDKLISPYNDNIYIKDIKYREDLTDTTVYHCRVDPYHTFIVEDIVAHNMKVMQN